MFRRARRERANAALRTPPLARAVVLGLLTAQPHGARVVHAIRSSDTGNVTLTNSLGGGAVLTATDMAPGQTVSGTVTIGNSGDSAASLRLAQSPSDDSPGSAAAGSRRC